MDLTYCRPSLPRNRGWFPISQDFDLWTFLILSPASLWTKRMQARVSGKAAYRTLSLASAPQYAIRS